MSLQVIRREVGVMLCQAKVKIDEARTAMARGTDRERVDAAGELTLLAWQRATLEQRLAEIDAHANAPDTMAQWFAEEIFNLKLRLMSWIGHA